MNNKSLIVIPAFNEEENIEKIVKSCMDISDVCVVNDCSTDHTKKILSNISDIHVINHTQNTHMAGALIDGLKYAYEQNYDYCITMDAGFSFDLLQIVDFINHEPIDLVLCHRTKKYNTPIYRRLLSIVGNLIYNIKLKTPIRFIKEQYYFDISANFRRYSRNAIASIISKNITSRSYDFMFETIKIIYDNKLSITQIPVSYNYTNSSLNLRVILDCLKIIKIK